MYNIDGVGRDDERFCMVKEGEKWNVYYAERGCKTTNKYFDSERGISRNQFLDEHNDSSYYRPEVPASNRSHSCEDLTDLYLGS